MKDKELMTKKEVAELLRSSLTTVDRLMSSGKLKYIKLEKKVLFRRKDIDRWLDSRVVKK